MDYPKCIYRRKDGEIESKIIDVPPVPDGWVESPADVDKAKPESKPVSAKPKRVRF